MANEIVVELVTRLDKAEQQINKFAKQTEKDLGFLRLSATNFVGAFTATAAFDAFKSGLSTMVGFMKDSIAASAEGEEAINALNVSLAQTGQYSKETSKALIGFASSIQETTKYGDDLVLKNMAVLQSLTGLEKDGLIRTQQAALDLASALQMDLGTATDLVAKAANGNISSFQRYGIAIEKGKTNAETFANTLELLESRFKGSAAAEAQTFTGATTALGNAFEDLQKQFGSIVTANPAVIEAMNFLKGMFANISEIVEQNKVGIKEFVGNGLGLLIQSIPYVVDGVIIMTEVWGGLNITFQALRNLLGIVVEGFGKILEFAGVSAESIVEWGKAQQDAAYAAAEADTESLLIRTENLQKFRDELALDAEESAIRIENANFADEMQVQTFENNRKREADAVKMSEKEKEDARKKSMTLAQQLELNFKNQYEKFQVDKVSAFQTAMGQISTLQQSENTKLFRIGQAAAIAQAIINTAQGITAAFALGPILGPILAPIVATAGAVQVGMIAAQKPPSSARDGIDFIPEDRMTWVASRGERVVGSRLNEDLSRFLDNQRGGGQSGSQVNNVNINISGVIGEFDDDSRVAIANEFISALEYQNVSRRGVI